MEDDDEIQSQLTPESGSPASPRSPGSPNGRIRVTVASVPPQKTPSSASLNTLTLALPIQQISATKNGSATGGGGGGGRDDCWSEGATSVLIDAWGERYLELSRGNLKQKHWKEVAAIVASRDDYSKTMKTDVQCKNRIDTVKKKYKLEKSKIAAGGGPSKWQFYQRLDHLIGPSAVKISTPVGIPVVIRSASTQQKQKMQFRRRAPADSDSDSPASTDSLPPPVTVKKPKIEQQEVKSSNPVVKISEKGGSKANSVRQLTEAILKLGEAYEQAETLKMQQVVEMEKQRMKFAKDLELQRMQFFLKTQMEISQMKKNHNHGGGGGRRNGNNHPTISNNNNNKNSNHNNNSNHSDSSN